MRICDKCGTPVDPTNDAVLLDMRLHQTRKHPDGVPFILFMAQARHLLPVGACEGSPSRAQYLEGIPRDERGYGYHPEHEEDIRAAYAFIQEKGEEMLAVPPDMGLV